MNSLSENTSNPYRQVNLKVIIGLLLLSISLTLLISSFELSVRYIILLVSFPVLFLVALNFTISSSILIISLFINIGFYYFAVSEILSIPLLISFLLTYNFKFGELKNQITIFFGFFIISIIPSYLNLFSYPSAFPLFLHLVFFFIVYTIFSIVIDNFNKIKNYLTLFLGMALLNSIDVFFSAILSEKRVFGFAGIMFVDYVGYAIIISFLAFIYKRKNKITFLILFLIFCTALIFTQTRSIWLIVGVTLFFMMVHILVKNKIYGINPKRTVLIFCTIVVLISGLILTLEGVNKGVFKRLEVNKIEQTNDPNQFFLQINSFVTRYFIWSTAWNAFNSSPIIGIGFYSFPFQSGEYADIEPIFYDTYVKNLTPHETFLAVLTESGLIGLVGFLSFLLYTLIYAYRSVKISVDGDEKNYSLIIFWLSIYTFLSMIVTDAWLWGHGLMLWSILIGTSIANRRLITTHKE